MNLRYGCNPHQTPSKVSAIAGQLPFKVLNGSLGYINVLDALNSWQLVQELTEATGHVAAASFKHVSPSGAALGLPLSDGLRKACRTEDMELSPVAVAYARARGADRLCSFGDWAAVSGVVDSSLALLLQREVSDGIIAPGYEPEALVILSKKKKGQYAIVEMDAAYRAPATESRDIFGLKLEQKRNDVRLGVEVLQNVVTKTGDWPAAAQRDALVALISLKYTQSNSVCVAVDGQVIGVGAGQQSRIHCTRLACDKADTWRLRQHPMTLQLKFRPEARRPDRDNAVDQYLRNDITPAERQRWPDVFSEIPQTLTPQQKQAWLTGARGAVLGSDAYFPFRDSIDRAHQSGVGYVVHSGGSSRDDEVIAACDEYGMTMAFSGIRLFHH